MTAALRTRQSSPNFAAFALVMAAIVLAVALLVGFAGRPATITKSTAPAVNAVPTWDHGTSSSSGVTAPATWDHGTSTAPSLSGTSSWDHGTSLAGQGTTIARDREGGPSKLRVR